MKDCKAKNDFERKTMVNQNEQKVIARRGRGWKSDCEREALVSNFGVKSGKCRKCGKERCRDVDVL
jgi:hypothetical protein